MLLVQTFKFEDIGIVEKKYYRGRESKSLHKNSKAYVDWVLRLLGNLLSPIPKGCEYDSCCLSWNSKNSLKLAKHIAPFSFLNFSPRDDDTLSLNQIAIDLSKVYSRIR
jgi:hypothetical protein